MKGEPTVGASVSADFRVKDDMGPPHLPVVVLSTPWMLGLVELVSLDVVRDCLDDGETLVGAGAQLRHTAAARLGETVTVSSTLVAVDRRRMTFDATVTLAGERSDVVVGTVTLESAVIDTSRFGR